MAFLKTLSCENTHSQVLWPWLQAQFVVQSHVELVSEAWRGKV